MDDRFRLVSISHVVDFYGGEGALIRNLPDNLRARPYFLIADIEPPQSFLCGSFGEFMDVLSDTLKLCDELGSVPRLTLALSPEEQVACDALLNTTPGEA